MRKIIIVLGALVVIGGGIWIIKHNSSQAPATAADRAAAGGEMQGDMDMSGNSTTATGTPDTSAGVTVDTGVTVGAGTEKTFTITGSNFSFSPSSITVNKGDKVKIVFANSGGTHDFKIDEYSVATPRISGGQSASVEFVADKSGTFDYYCSVGSHRAMGMQGTLIVK